MQHDSPQSGQDLERIRSKSVDILRFHVLKAHRAKGVGRGGGSSPSQPDSVQSG